MLYVLVPGELSALSCAGSAVVHDPGDTYLHYFRNVLGRNFHDPGVAFDTVRFILRNLETLCHRTKVLSSFFPNILKVGPVQTSRMFFTVKTLVHSYSHPCSDFVFVCVGESILPIHQSSLSNCTLLRSVTSYLAYCCTKCDQSSRSTIFPTACACGN